MRPPARTLPLQSGNGAAHAGGSVWAWGLGLWAVIALFVLGRGMMFGQLGSDSCGYLQLAQQLVDGKGFRLPALGKPDQWFAVWPVGYPVLIALVAKATGLTVVLASKVANVVLAGVNLWMLRCLLGDAFKPWGALLLLAPMIEISSYTWSEVPFITGLLWLGVALQRFLLQDRAMPLHAASMALAVVFMFLSRYIGAFGGIVIGLVAMWALWRRDWRRMAWSVAAATLVTGFVLAYLAHNRAEVGLSTGMPRVPAPESLGALAWMTVKAYAKHLDVLVAVFDVDTPFGQAWVGLTTLALAMAALYVWLGRNATGAARTPGAAASVPTRAWVSLAVIGVLYWGAITTMRWLTHFDRLSLRLLFPGTLLVMLALVLLVHRRGGAIQARLQQVVLPLVALSLVGVLATDVRRALSGEKPWPWTAEEARLRAELAAIPAGAVVVFGPDALAFLRTDLLQVRPRTYPLFATRQDWPSFAQELARGAQGRPVYVFVETDLDPARFDPTVISAMQSMAGQRLVRLTP